MHVDFYNLLGSNETQKVLKGWWSHIKVQIQRFPHIYSVTAIFAYSQLAQTEPKMSRTQTEPKIHYGQTNIYFWTILGLEGQAQIAGPKWHILDV